MRLLILSLAFALAAVPVFPHDTWLLPTRFAADAGAPLTAEMTSAMRFPHAETAIKTDRIAHSGVRVGAKTAALAAVGTTASALRLRSPAVAAGVAAMWVELHPRPLDLKDSQVEEYLHEIGASDTAGAEWRQSGRKPWRETYVKCAKSFVRVGGGARDTSWSEPVGLALELVPEADPTGLIAGSKLALRLLRGAAPLARHPVAAQAAGGDPVLARTDDEGRVTFVLDRAGPWLIKSTVLRRKQGSAEWESEFTTLTLATRPPVR
jgi:uncharacterized GH25 family protein